MEMKLGTHVYYHDDNSIFSIINFTEIYVVVLAETSKLKILRT